VNPVNEVKPACKGPSVRAQVNEVNEVNARVQRPARAQVNEVKARAKARPTEAAPGEANEVNARA
jgi:hypothetical protein